MCDFLSPRGVEDALSLVEHIELQMAKADTESVRNCFHSAYCYIACMDIRHATVADHSSIANIIMPVFRAGETYTIDPDIREADAIAYWTAPDKTTFVTVIDGEVLGTYYIKANQAGGGRHICNCGYMTHGAATGRGIASAMCEHSLSFAKSRGFKAMQFNFVVSNNLGAIRLWKKFGFQEVGRLPAAFNHPSEGYLDALIMHRAL